jgi:quercetin dioxygenase-like cupin family protein
MPMSAPVRDPVHRARYSFEPDGQNLIVDCWIEPGGKLPEHLHPRQEERWSVIDGRIRLGLGNTKRTARWWSRRAPNTRSRA